MFMNIGFPFFDRYRRVFMKFAFIWTLIGFICVLIGCLAIINNDYLIRTCYWSTGVTYDAALPVKGVDYAAVYIGLSGYVVSTCDALTNSTVGGSTEFEESSDGVTPDYDFSYNPSDDFDCSGELFSWSGAYDNGWSGQCSDAALATVVAAFTSWFPMIFAMSGALNRMRVKSDAPQQKILGCITDTFGAASLAFTLLAFETGCHTSMSRTDLEIKVGPGEDEVYEFPKMYWWRGSGYW